MLFVVINAGNVFSAGNAAPTELLVNLVAAVSGFTCYCHYQLCYLLLVLKQQLQLLLQQILKINETVKHICWET